MSFSPFLFLFCGLPALVHCYVPPCPAGQHLSGGTCVPCPLGTWSPNNNRLTNCYACDLLGGCQSCDATSGACTSCPGGFYILSTGCLQCPSNTYSPGGAVYSCLPCDSSCSSCDSSSGACLLCPQGSFIYELGCQHCAGLTWSDGTFSSCQRECPFYHFPPSQFSILRLPACALTGGCSNCSAVSGACTSCAPPLVPVGPGCANCATGQFKDSGICKSENPPPPPSFPQDTHHDNDRLHSWRRVHGV